MVDGSRAPVAFWREHPDGRREVANKTFLLIWIAPALLLLAAAGSLIWESYRYLATRPAEGIVVRVYAWEGGGLFGDKMLYGPVFRYTWSDGEPTEASPGLSHPDWNLEIGSTHQIRYFAREKTNVVFGGSVNFAAGMIVLAIGLATALPAGWAHRRLTRWRDAGA